MANITSKYLGDVKRVWESIDKYIVPLTNEGTNVELPYLLGFASTLGDDVLDGAFHILSKHYEISDWDDMVSIIYTLWCEDYHYDDFISDHYTK